eukprot:TRINITY_DN6982_c0_g1_i1.p1 TRINITY_DN6982_c0_g1~~TRINITY_DN6982_c0_g1_i1.p1  ORF type:complete len:311 (+),score=10.45 TRINITY_DN6982_c0_g1_i1:30-962(+)
MEIFDLVVYLTILTLVPFLFDGLNAVFPGKIQRLPQKMASTFLFLCVALAMSLAIYYYLLRLLPFYVYAQVGSKYSIAFHLTFFMYLVYNTIYHFVASNLVGPGFVHTVPHIKAEQEQKKEGYYCEDCKIHPPPNSYHCKVCGGCSLNFDHHCPFVARCIGLKNQKHFFLMLFFLFVDGLYALRMTVYPFWRCYINFEQFFDEKECRWLGKDSLTFLCIVFGMVPITSMFVWQLFVGYTKIPTRKFVSELRKNQSFRSLFISWIMNGDLANFSEFMGGNIIETLFFPWANKPSNQEIRMLYKKTEEIKSK